jgi:galactokinase
VHIPGDPPVRLLLAFQNAFPSMMPEWVTQAPGREMWTAAKVDTQPEFTIFVPDLEARTTFSLRSAKTRTTVMNRPLPRWARYAAGVLIAMCESGMEIPGFQAVVIGTEPNGPRYEYAIGMTVAALCCQIARETCEHEQLLELLERVRRDYVEGT